jgi:uncharacterized protein (TIGR02231 family)
MIASESTRGSRCPPRSVRTAARLALFALAPVTGFALDVMAVTSRVTTVTLFADRARVTRAGTVSLPAGQTRLTFAGLPGWLDEESLQTGLAPAQAGRVVDVDVRREFLTRSDNPELREAETALRAMEDQVAAIDDELKVLETQARHTEEARAFAVDRLPREAAAGTLDVKRYADMVSFAVTTLRQTATARREALRQRRELEPELAARQRRLAELRGKAQLEQRTVLVTVEAAGATQAEATLTYLLPGATWQPVHELRFDGRRPDRVTLASSASVSQMTGEDWNDARLAFSTQSPTEVARIPEVTALRLGGDIPLLPLKAGSAVSSFGKAAAVYEVQNPIWIGNRFAAGDAVQMRDNSTRQRGMIADATAAFERVRSRGTSAQFAAEGVRTVRSDGSVVRLPIGRADLPARHQVIAAPEVSLNAAHTVDLANKSGQPLLPGRVSLYRDGTFLGLTELDFVAEGENFALLTGVEDRLKLSRVLDRRRSALVRGARTRMQVAFDVTAQNLSDEAVEVRLLDRVPVSEDREVRVFDVEVEPDGKPDGKGLLTWNLSLKPRASQTYRVAYTIEYPAALLAARRRADPTRDAAQQAAPAQPAGEQLYRDIEALEKRF